MVGSARLAAHTAVLKLASARAWQALQQQEPGSRLAALQRSSLTEDVRPGLTIGCGAERPYLTLDDRNVTYIALDGVDPQLDVHRNTTEPILLRIFLAAVHETSRSITASAARPEEQLLVRATIHRESLERQPRWNVDGNPRHHFVCLAHKWQPRFYLQCVPAAARLAAGLARLMYTPALAGRAERHALHAGRWTTAAGSRSRSWTRRVRGLLLAGCLAHTLTPAAGVDPWGALLLHGLPQAGWGIRPGGQHQALLLSGPRAGQLLRQAL